MSYRTTRAFEIYASAVAMPASAVETYKAALGRAAYTTGWHTGPFPSAARWVDELWPHVERYAMVRRTQ